MQKNIWEQEYRLGRLVTGHDEPQPFVRRFMRFLKKNETFDLSKAKVLDLGCGTGRNSNYFAQVVEEVVGLEISDTALNIARNRTRDNDLRVDYMNYDIGSKYVFDDNYFDIVLDVTSSNSLDERSRDIYLQEVYRVLKLGGYFFVRALCKDGDKNAKYLIENYPGGEKDTYIMPELGLKERVFTEIDFRSAYKYFHIIRLKKESSYSKVGGRNFKRNFWVAWMQK